MIISERIIKVLKERNMTQAEFAKQVGISTSTISEWKKRKTNPTVEKIMDICNVLQITPEQLLTGKGIEDEEEIAAASPESKFTPGDVQMIEDYHNLKEEQQKRLMAYMEALKKIERYFLMKTKEQNIMDNYGEIIIYQTEDGLTKLEVKMENDTVWLTQAQLVELYQSSKANVSEHITNIFKEGELVQEAVVRKFRTTASDGKNYNVLHYNLDMIISLGYRINSATATKFRQWATQRLKEYIIKGFTIDDERLKGNGGGNYWKELLDRIRDIRSSEKVLYRQVLDLYATSVDYNPKSDESIQFSFITRPTVILRQK